MSGHFTTDESQAAASGKTEFISFAIGNDQYDVDIMAARENKARSQIVAPVQAQVIALIEVSHPLSENIDTPLAT